MTDNKTRELNGNFTKGNSYAYKICANCHRIIEHEKRNQTELEVLD
jgi:predicted HNH restriction endonuclease